MINSAFWFSIQFTGKNIQRLENSTSKNGAPISVRSKIMWHTGDLHVANKELIASLWIFYKLYNRVPREDIIWHCLRESGVAETYVRVVEDMY